MTASQIIYTLNLDKGITRAPPETENGWNALTQQIGHGVHKNWTAALGDKNITHWTAQQTLPIINARLAGRGHTINQSTLSLNSTVLYIFVGRVTEKGTRFMLDEEMLKACSAFWDQDDNLDKILDKDGEVKLPDPGKMLDEHRLAYLILSLLIKLPMSDGRRDYTFAGVVDMGYLEATSARVGSMWPSWLLNDLLGPEVQPSSRSLPAIDKHTRLYYLYPWIGGAWKEKQKSKEAKEGQYNLPDEPGSDQLMISSDGVVAKVSAKRDEDEALAVLKRVAMHNLYAFTQMTKEPQLKSVREMLETKGVNTDDPVIRAAFGCKLREEEEEGDSSSSFGGCACKLAKQLQMPEGMYGGCAKCKSVPLPWVK
jgi:hypothetical protein